MRTEFSAQENVPLAIELSSAEAQSLMALGKELSSRATWWGGSPLASSERTVITVHQRSRNQYSVVFNNVVGLVQIGRCQISVSPKIASNHFWHIISRSSLSPRLSSEITLAARGAELVELLAHWCVSAAEKLMRQGLRKDYKERIDELSHVQGQIHILGTVQCLYRGNLQTVCEFDELSEDSPLNRVVKTACEQIARIDLVSVTVRQRARRVAYRMDGVGLASPADLRVKLDRLSLSYSQVLPLSLMVLQGCGVGAARGEVQGLTFLMRTPELLEDGLRAILAALITAPTVTKRRLFLNNSSMSINPDLVFGKDLTVGDVKYRHLGSDWSRGDFNQIVTFATGFRCRHAALVGFTSHTDQALPRPARIGEVAVRAFGWVADPRNLPIDSAQALAKELQAWLGTVEP